ncbi:glycosyltransferase [Escherichia coli]|jgi:glycosyltransferase involved in cell wall biosynthesis|uniref:glycosyltransferase n=1 Tax=Escherichia coli TaxID=562 RepID=UPI0007E9081B|nr:glycosyltransferase [Escherichia coli]EFN8595739.1 glycosyltransferase [Escherichia coli O41:H11]EEQ3641485.1 glycosyltransferase [Escherichia coli]EEW2595137.1 glycosyltransferase [Escherichia coli]EEZ0425073.1 glycosyltransferase [Escherichia coli]EEZ6660133.1 glycosyltransferase [Escherichia coli]
MKILILSHSDILGGASIAAYRLHRALLNNNINSTMMVRIKKTDDFTVIGPKGNLEKVLNKIRSPLGGYINSLSKTCTSGYRSGNWLPSGWVKRINEMDIDIVHIHWVGAETLSIEDIGKIKKPVIWTLHDMWPFCGTEHYASDTPKSRWRNNYIKESLFSCLDLERIVWKRKKRSWSNDISIVSPSSWLFKCAKDSSLFSRNHHFLIPNALDLTVFKPLEKHYCRKILNIDADKKIILFGAIGGVKDERKGYDLLIKALELIVKNDNITNIQCLVFGQSIPEQKIDLPVDIKWLGHIHDNITLSLMYNAANVMVVPSRQDNLPQTATEAQACGCPVVAFDCTGFPDIIAHKITGYLAKPYDFVDLARGISWVIDNREREDNLSKNAVKKAQDNWSEEKVASEYIKLYENILNSKNHNAR